jgi:asparagine synthase (glutamine-hydrolysing)
MSERPLGCLLSGGLDSSLVASIAASTLKEEGKKLRTFSIGMDNATDISFAREVAKHIDSDHT